MIADTYTQVSRAITAPTDPPRISNTGYALTYCKNPHLAPSNPRHENKAPSQTSLNPTSVFGIYLYRTINVENDRTGDTACDMILVRNSKLTSGNTITSPLWIDEAVGATKSSSTISIPAPATSAMSISRSFMNGRVLWIPQAMLIPFLIAPNAAEAAHISPSTDTIPVMIVSDATPLAVRATNPEDTGMTSATCSASSTWLTSGPRKNPQIETVASISGNIEKSI